MGSRLWLSLSPTTWSEQNKKRGSYQKKITQILFHCTYIFHYFLCIPNYVYMYNCNKKTTTRPIDQVNFTIFSSIHFTSTVSSSAYIKWTWFTRWLWQTAIHTTTTKQVADYTEMLAVKVDLSYHSWSDEV